jgi:hypothetical protein
MATSFTLSGSAASGTSVALVSLATAKSYLGETGSSNDDLISAMINEASVAICKEIGVGNLIETTYTRELHDGHGGRDLYLNNWPVSEVLRVAVWRDSAMTVSYSGDNTHANVLVTETSLKIRTAASGTWSTTSFAFSSYATIDLLAAAVGAISGWTASAVSGYGDYPSTELLPRPASNAKSETVELEIPEENDDDIELASADWGILHRGVGWSKDVQNIAVDYTAGYSQDAVPQPLQSACKQLVAALWSLRDRDPGMTGETLGDYEYKVSEWMGSLLDSNKAQALIYPLIRNYRRPYVYGA